MLSFMQSWLGSAANPIGVDFGTDCLRLAQVEKADGEHRLIAAACADVPSSARNDPAARLAFFTQSLRELLTTGNFRGRRAVLALPAASMYIQHLRVPPMDDDAMRKALPWEARGKLPFDPSHALLRHVVAGEVHSDQDPKSEVILMAARRDMVEQLLAAAAKAKLDVVGMNVEPKALIDCFSQIYRRKSDADVTSCFLDIGCNASRAVIARGGQILFARVIAVGGEHFSKAVAQALKLPLEEAKLLRIRLAVAGTDESAERQAPIAAPVARAVSVEPAADADPENSFALLGVATRAAEGAATLAAPAVATSMIARPQQEMNALAETSMQARVDMAVREPLMRLVEELALCRRYHEATFPSSKIDRLIFVGGEARHRGLCQAIAREAGIAAQVGDPMVRMARISDIAAESGIDRRVPQPAWSVAIGLSMGPSQAVAEKAPPKE